MNVALFALVALIPVMMGEVPPDQGAASMTARLCGGGTVTIPLPYGEPDAPAPCHAKGCHAGCSRKRFDPAQ